MRALVSLRLPALAVALAAASAGCQHTPRNAGEAAEAETREPAPSRARREVISAEEIAKATEAQDAYDLVRRLRPTYLADRGATSFRSSVPRTAQVYVDNMRLGGLEQLRNIPRDNIAEIRFFSGPDATTRWGTGHSSGVIHVATKR